MKDVSKREESGTPDIIGSFRAGLALFIRQNIDLDFFLDRERAINLKVSKRLSEVKNLFIIGKDTLEKIPIYSFLIRFNGKFLHYSFVSGLLSDLFGIQSRGGCSCSSIYGQVSMGISDCEMAEIEKIVLNGQEIFRPGYTRVNFPYFYPDFVLS